MSHLEWINYFIFVSLFLHYSALVCVFTACLLLLVVLFLHHTWMALRACGGGLAGRHRFHF